MNKMRNINVGILLAQKWRMQDRDGKNDIIS